MDINAGVRSGLLAKVQRNVIYLLFSTRKTVKERTNDSTFPLQIPYFEGRNVALPFFTLFAAYMRDRYKSQ